MKVGLHPEINLDSFTGPEQQIIHNNFAKKWLITNARSISKKNNDFRFILLKPSEEYVNKFNLNRELILIFSPFSKFDTRSIEAIDIVNDLYPQSRLEEICSIIVSNDSAIEEKLSDILKQSEESKIIIPFSYDELIAKQNDSYHIENKFRQEFYSRDLFGFRDALKKDLYFFGRRDFVHSIVDRHLSHENSGIFGLRKTGKTSILFSIERVLKRKSKASIFIDCEVLHLKEWNIAIFFIVDQIREKYGLKKTVISNKTEYSVEGDVPELFKKDIKSLYRKNGKKNILIIFDEIEHITFDTSVSDGWKSGDHFIKFWQTLRSAFQTTKNVFSYLLAGTNPKCVETSTINGVDNPIYLQVPPEYIPSFDMAQTNEMVNKLGGYMGLKFDDIVCANLTQDFGGHPFLIRQVCSTIHEKIGISRPKEVTKIEYEKFKPDFILSKGNTYSKMVLEVLERFYPDEHHMLEILSSGDKNTFLELAEGAPEYTAHLINYGILKKSSGDYAFEVDILKTYLSSKNKYKRLNQTNSEKQQEISKRRNLIEPKLRKIVRVHLMSTFGQDVAKDKVLSKWGKDSKKRNKFSSLTYKDLFDPNKHEIYLKDLFDLIRKNWEDCFKNLFEGNVEIFEAKSRLINHYRKVDSHACEIKDTEMTSFRGAMAWLEEIVEDL